MVSMFDTRELISSPLMKAWDELRRGVITD